MTANAGATVTPRLSQTGMWRRKKPCMMICPLSVPTAEEESPEASSETANSVLAARPKSGSSVRCASSSALTSTKPCLWKVSAAITSMAALTRPATLMATTTSTT